MIYYKDLLNRPWARWNCGEVVAEYLRRMGLDEAANWIPVDQETAARAIRDDRDLWRKVGAEPQRVSEIGVVILSDGPEGELHSAITVGGGLALTSSRKRGVHATHLRAYRGQNVHGCYAWSGPL